ncbi:flavin oxidoreductase [Lewinellaceae bacterium SD302]|nr:flavin oxidoreductase [Lewinellaceae bacterium SD302]
MRLSLADILAKDGHFRRNFMNTLPGPRTAHLIGTKGHRGNENLGVFNTVVHLQASPPLMGFILRPLTVPRETYHNILANRHYTINTIHPDWLDAAHQSSANYPVGTSEFAATNLKAHYSEGHQAPYVAGSPVKIGLEYVETHQLHGGTSFVIGRVIEVILENEQAISESGHLNHELLETMTVAGLDRYYLPQKEQQKEYARVK